MSIFSPLQDLKLLSHHTQHFQIYPVELVKTAPRSRLCETGEEPGEHLEVEPFRAVEHDTLFPETLGEVLDSLCFAGTSRASRCSSQMEVQSCCQRQETSV